MIPKKHQYFGMEIYVDENDSDMAHFFRDRIPYEPHVTDTFVEAVRGRRFLDVGANIGFYSLLALKSGASNVVAVEPNPANCHLLSLNIGGRASIIQMAAGNETRMVRFHHGGSNGGVSDEGTDLVRMAPLWREVVVGEPEVIKLDVEGYEMFVVEGLLWPDSYRPCVFTEFYPELLEGFGCDPVKYLDFFFSKSGYRVFVMDKLSRRKIQCGTARDVMNVWRESERRETRRIAYLDLFITR